MYSDNLTQKVAQAAAKIMDEELKGKQHKIDANKNGKVDAHDFKLLRAKKEVKEESEQIDELSKATMGSYVNKSAKDAVDRTAQEVETGEIDKVADKRMKGIKLATKKLAKEETAQVEEGYYKNMDTNRKEEERLSAKKKKDTPPFTPDKPKAKVATPGKFGYGYSAARHLARQGMASVTKEESEQIAEDVTVKKDYDDNEQSEHGVYKGKKQIGYVVHNKKENTHTAYHGPQGRDDFGHIDDFPDHNKAVSQIKKSAGIKEDVTKTSSGYIHHARPGVYGGSEKEKHVVDTLRGPKKSELNAIEKEKKMKKSFSEMVELYNEIGLKSLSNMISEEPDNEQFTQELKDQQAKSEGKGKKAEVAKGAVQAVKQEEVEQIDELSKKTLGDYITRNADDQARIGFINSAAHHDKTTDSKTKNKILDRNERQGINRDIGLTRAVNKLTKEDQDFINELNKSTLGSYVNKSAKDAVDRTAQEVETGEIDKVADKRMKGIKLATKKLAKEETAQVEEGYYKNMDTNRKEEERLSAKKKKDTPPFTPDKPKAKVATPGKFGYGYSAARHLARQGMASVTKEESEQIAEDVTVKKDYDDNEQSEHGVYKGKKQIGYVVHNKKENTHTAYHGPQGRDDFGHIDDFPDHNKAVSQIKKSAGIKEDVTKTSSGYIHHARPGVYGGSEKEKHVVDTLRGPKKSELNAIEKEKKMKKSFSEMVELYNEIGLKSLSNMISEEPDNEQFTQELKDQQAKSEGKGKKAEVAKGAVQAVKQEEVEQLDELSPKTLGSYVKKANKDVRNISADHEASEYRQARRDDGVSAKEIGDPDSEKDMRDNERRLKTRDRGVKKATNKLIKKAIGENIEERSLTEPEMEKKEEIVKSMKKGLSGFKARYGKDAKSVMYATATKQAKGD